MFTLIKTTASKYSTVPVHFERSSIDEGFLIFEFENVKKLRGSGEYDDDDEEEDEDEDEDEEEDESLPPTELDEDDRMIECQKVVRRDFYKFFLFPCLHFTIKLLLLSIVKYCISLVHALTFI